MGLTLSQLPFPTALPGTCIGSPDKVPLKLSKIIKTIKQESTNKKLTKEAFNKCIQSLLYNQSFPLLAYTHLCSSLFSLLLTDKKSNLISETLFIKALCQCLISEDFRTRALFEVVKSNPTAKIIIIDDLFEFYFKSFQKCLHLSHFIVGKYYSHVFANAGVQVPDSSQEFAVNYTKFKKDGIYKAVEFSLNEVNIHKDQVISFDMFKKWSLKDNSIEIKYGNDICFRYATSLVFMEGFELEMDCGLDE